MRDLAYITHQIEQTGAHLQAIERHLATEFALREALARAVRQAS